MNGFTDLFPRVQYFGIAQNSGELLEENNRRKALWVMQNFWEKMFKGRAYKSRTLIMVKNKRINKTYKKLLSKSNPLYIQKIYIILHLFDY